MHLDSWTIAAVAFLTTLAVSLLGVLLWQTRSMYAGFGRWTVGNTCVAMSLLFLCVRGLVPDVVSVVGTNAFAFMGVVLLLEGTREFRGLRPRWWPAYVMAGSRMLAPGYFLVRGNHVGVPILVIS